VSLEFLAPGAAAADDRFQPVACSPMERDARAAGARFELRDGWNVAVEFASTDAELQACRRTAGWADVSHLGKLELQAPAADIEEIAGQRLELGRATWSDGAWWCRLTPERALVVAEPAALPALRERLAATTARLVEVTNVFAALTVVGPLAREVLARLTALDLRPAATPVGALRPGSIARQPAVLIREDTDRFLFLFGWAVGHYLWTVVDDAGRHLGAVPIGADALEQLAPAAEEAPSRA
jgi:heterotetrameric sarcosine oxidase gamma subunit